MKGTRNAPTEQRTLSYPQPEKGKATMSKITKVFRNHRQARTLLPEDIESPEVWAEKNCQRMPDKDTFAYNFHYGTNNFGLLLRLAGNGWEAGLNVAKPRYVTRYHDTPRRAISAYVQKLIDANVKVTNEMKKAVESLDNSKENDNAN